MTYSYCTCHWSESRLEICRYSVKRDKWWSPQTDHPTMTCLSAGTPPPRKIPR